jgi:hypothetical protein
MRGHVDKVFAVREWRKIARLFYYKKYDENYRQTHRKQHREFCRRWYLSLRGKKKRVEWNKLHPEYEKEHRAKRRKLGFIPLNELFENSQAHHIDFECVIYIPEQLHQSISHNVWTGQGMTEINDKVFEWLELKMLEFP